MTPEVVNGSGARSAPSWWFGASSTCVCLTKIIAAVDATLKRCRRRTRTGHEVTVAWPRVAEEHCCGCLDILVNGLYADKPEAFVEREDESFLV